MLDFNHTALKAKAANIAVNAAIDTAPAAQGQRRDYLGASALGYECLRKVQASYLNPKAPDAQLARIFQRGHWWERYARELLWAAGFQISEAQTGFTQLGGKFRGHCDGVIRSGPPILLYPCLWETKCLGDKGWNKLNKDGLRKAYPHYYVQVQLYMAYLDLNTNPALFTACNANTMELLHLLVPFDAACAQEWSDKAVTVIRASEAGEVLPRVSDDPSDFRCKFCDYREGCWQ